MITEFFYTKLWRRSWCKKQASFHPAYLENNKQTKLLVSQKHPIFLPGLFDEKKKTVSGVKLEHQNFLIAPASYES